MKLKDKKRVDAKIIKHHGVAQTPYERILVSPTVSEETKQRLGSHYQELNPMALQRSMHKKIKRIEQYQMKLHTVTVTNLATYPIAEPVR